MVKNSEISHKIESQDINIMEIVYNDKNPRIEKYYGEKETFWTAIVPGYKYERTKYILYIPKDSIQTTESKLDSKNTEDSD